MIFTSTTNQTTAIGPLWFGNIHVKNVIQELRTILSQKTLNMKSRLWKLLNIFEEEADYPPFFYTMDNLASSLKLSAPKMNTMFEELTRKGYKAVRTQFSSTGFKTDAPQKVVIATFKRKGRK
jgi:tRNA (guanine26-N2/guanine27-N2)-dimethyltransferase